MRKRNGFTLTEVVIAVVIVGMVGVAVASLSSMLSRNSSSEMTRLLLRNNLSRALRQIRQDMQQGTVVTQTDTSKSAADLIPDCTETRPPYTELLRLRNPKNEDLILYLFQPGKKRANPSGTSVGTTVPTNECTAGNPALDKGRIVRRLVSRVTTNYSSGRNYEPSRCDSCDLTVLNWVGSSTDQGCQKRREWCFKNTDTVLLENVKFIPLEDTLHYPVPLFKKMGGSAVKVNLIVEVPDSSPVLNEAVEEVFFTL